MPILERLCISYPVRFRSAHVSFFGQWNVGRSKITSLPSIHETSNVLYRNLYLENSSVQDKGHSISPSHRQRAEAQASVEQKHRWFMMAMYNVWEGTCCKATKVLESFVTATLHRASWLIQFYAHIGQFTLEFIQLWHQWIFRKVVCCLI